MEKDIFRKYKNSYGTSKKELFDSDSSFRFVVYGDTNDNNNWDGDSGEVNHNGTLENDIRYYDHDITFSDLNSIVVVVN